MLFVFDFEIKNMQYLVWDNILFCIYRSVQYGSAASARILSSNIFINQHKSSLSCNICDFF